MASAKLHKSAATLRLLDQDSSLAGLSKGPIDPSCKGPLPHRNAVVVLQPSAVFTAQLTSLKSQVD